MSFVVGQIEGRAWGDRLAHHFFPGNSSGQPEPRASGVFHQILNPRIATPPAFKLQTARRHTQKHQICQSAAAARWDDTWHTCTPRVSVARWRWRWRQRRDPACRNINHHPNSRTRRRAAVAGWTQEVTAESGRHTLQHRQVGRVWTRVPDLTDGSRNLSLSSMPCNKRPPCGEPSIVVWHGCGTTLPRRRFQRSWRPKAHSSLALETRERPLQPLAACQTQGQTGSSPFRPQPRSVRARFGWRSRTPESPMAIPTQVPDRETGRRGEGTAVQTSSDPVSKITPDESRF